MEIFGYVLLALFIGSFVLAAFRLGARRARTCQLCGKPRDPNSKADGIWEYGILACDECGKQLHARYKDEPMPREPPPWARP